MTLERVAQKENQSVSSTREVHGAMEDDGEFVAALRRGDETAFLRLVEQHHRTMVRVARGFVGSEALAEEVAQEAWLGVLKGLEGFEGRSTLKSWIFRILTNCAKSRGSRERRTQPFSSLGSPADDEPSVDPDRFIDDRHPRWPGGWSSPPAPWADEQCLSKETLALVQRAIEGLPPGQREVVTLRDVEELSSEEVCEMLGISEVNQRVLLHRARSKIRAALEVHLRGKGAAS
jgi:RNA polymerase sigma-70 factor (ECF subfamily)